ncbi:MAG: UbiA family prenyltransferase, partial [Candidatus Korarchaeota archaeon]|nr:UbiA family prenyltransferase [Candidatus Korarchaeota archaeon]
MRALSVRAIVPVPRLVSAALSLSRAREYILQLTLVFPVIEMVAPGLLLSVRAILAYSANFLYTAFAYSFNDVEDAEDDALDPVKGARNPVSSGVISRRAGYLISLAFLAAGLALMAAISLESLLSGSLFSVNSAAYSWRRLRLKAVPVLDLVSHAATLGVPQL